MNFYSVRLDNQDNEPLGTDGKMLFKLKTIRGAINRCKCYGNKPFRLYTYTNFYNDKTFRLIHEQNNIGEQ